MTRKYSGFSRLCLRPELTRLLILAVGATRKKVFVSCLAVSVSVWKFSPTNVMKEEEKEDGAFKSLANITRCGSKCLSSQPPRSGGQVKDEGSRPSGLHNELQARQGCEAG